ncbi:MAG: ROK family protein [Sphingomonas sp.]|nr:ROK family protein [Sphingomonas sp.]
MSRTIAVCDIGGTHARFALAEIDRGGVVSLSDPVILKTAAYSSFQAAWEEFGKRAGHDLPSELGMSFAGPVGGEVLKLTNNPWVIRPALLEERLGVTSARIVNDFGAVGYAVATLSADRFHHLSGPEIPLPSVGVTTIIGPGTGLGVAQVLRTSHGSHVIETEGGHVDFAPLDTLEDQILGILRRTLRRVSVERIVAGSGLANIYHALSEIEGKPSRHGDDLALWAAALSGSDPLAVVALDRLFLSLGAVAGDLALAHGANSVVIAGGLGYRLRDRFATSGFADRFIAKGRFERRTQAIPVKLITHPEPGLYGAAAAYAEEHP